MNNQYELFSKWKSDGSYYPDNELSLEDIKEFLESIEKELYDED